MLYKPNTHGEQRQIPHDAVFGQLAIRISLGDFELTCMAPGDVVEVCGKEYSVKGSSQISDSIVQVDMVDTSEQKSKTTPLGHPGILGDIFKVPSESFSTKPDMYIHQRWTTYVDEGAGSETAALLVIAEILYRKNQCPDTPKTEPDTPKTEP